MSPKKCPFPWNLSPHLIITVSWAKQTLYPEWHLDWLTLVSNRQTDHATSATIDCILHYTRRTHTRLTALFPGLPRWAGTRKVNPIWILLKQETVSGSGISWAICKSAPRQHPTTVFYRLDALPAAQPTASKYWRQITLSMTMWPKMPLHSCLCPDFIEWWLIFKISFTKHAAVDFGQQFITKNPTPQMCRHTTLKNTRQIFD